MFWKLSALFAAIALAACATPRPHYEPTIQAQLERPRGGVRLNTFHCLNGACPVGAPAGNALIVREIYALSTNGETKFADWVAYVVTPQTVGRSQSRNWAADPWLDPNETLQPGDYDGANAALGTDRGHQAPLAAFSGTDHWRDTNYLSNITPQMAPLNQGPWEHLESRERALAEAGARVYVLTGPLYERDMPSLPEAQSTPHRIPSGYWKVVIAGNGAAATAFIMEQDTPRGAHYCAHIVAIDEVERRSGLRLLPRVQRALGAFDADLGCASN